MLEGLTDHVHNGLYNRTKVTHMMDSVKVDSLNTVTAMILANRDFCKDFDNSFTLYKDFLNQSNSTASDTGRVQEVSSGRRGRSGDKDVEYR